MNEEMIEKLGMGVLTMAPVQAGIHAAILSGIHAVVILISPYIVPALAVLGIVIAAAGIVLLTKKVAEWIMENHGDF